VVDGYLVMEGDCLDEEDGFLAPLLVRLNRSGYCYYVV